MIAVFVSNRLPSPSTQGLSPYQLMFDCSLDYSILKTFGCLCFPVIPKANQLKLDCIATHCCFLGYTTKYKGYLCLNVANSTILISQDVHFDESSFLFKSPTITMPSPPLLPDNDHFLDHDLQSPLPLLSTTSNIALPTHPEQFHSHFL